MRARKPWVRARFKLLGWNVRFMAVPENWQFVVIQSSPGDAGDKSRKKEREFYRHCLGGAITYFPATGAQPPVHYGLLGSAGNT